MEQRERIEERLEREGITAKEWKDDPSEGAIAVLGKYRVIESDDDAGLYQDDEGQLTASVAGASEYHNERVVFSFLPDDYADDSMGGNEVKDLSTIEAV